MRNKLSLDDYQAVRALTSNGSFRAAAENLGVSPSSLSRQIGAIEECLGTRLFDRDTRNVVPTAQGLLLADIAERMLNTADNGMVEFESYLAVRNGRLVIAGLPSVTTSLLPSLLQRFTLEHPNVDLRILDTLSDSVLHAVESGEADIGFTAGTVGTRARLSFHRILDDEFVAVGTSDGPLAEDRSYAWSELLDMPFIAMARGTSVRELLDGACLSIGRVLEPRFEVAHLATAGALVAQGLGVTALPTLTLPVLGATRLVLRPIPDFGAKRRIGLVWSSGRTLSPAAQSFLDLARAIPMRDLGVFSFL
ncbi:LysR family transcriptional regulator [Phyllobacterium phragmitis]|uniref:LysR family transcriptional regulator n=1 Tax=Phyllobacterium phragmitis TaxID=2670329 RepID=A0A2S9IPE9_9HYPH|nr:LysR family transcriptional regulator [Phyllobacterium phragmitis]PRD42385.1 LysR family transcriptional regulator [Phyllobacterium phragmitis]